MTELRPCPFCGGKAKLYRDRPIGVSPCMIKPHIDCTECTASMYASSAVQVIEAWNRRMTDDKTPPYTPYVDCGFGGE